MKKIFGTCIISLILFVACQKDSPKLNPVTVLSDSTQLLKYVELDTSSGVVDTLSVTSFSYDNAGRNTAITLAYYNSGMPTNEQYHSLFTYSGNDSFPSGQAVTVDFPDSDPHYANDLYFYTYINGQLLYDSIVKRSAGSIIRYQLVNHYAYLNGAITDTGVALIFDSTGTNTGESDFVIISHISRVNGNNMGQMDTTIYGVTDSYQFAYDSHPNPFSKTQNKLANNYYDFPYYTLDEPRIQDGFGKNNPTEIHFNGNGGFSDNHSFYQYEYNAAGYPVRVRYTGAGNIFYPIVGLFIYGHSS